MWMTSSSAKVRSAALAAACVLFAAGRADGAEPLSLTWQAPPECPQKAAVRARIDALVPGAASSRERLEADGRIVRIDGRFRLELMMRVGELRGERQIDSHSCKDLAGAAAVALGLMLQTAEAEETDAAATAARTGAESSTTEPREGAQSAARAASPTSERSDASPSAARETPSDAEEAPAEPDDAESGARSWAVSVHGLVALDVGPLPGAAWGGAFGGGLAVRDFRVFLDFQVGPAQSLANDDEPGLRAEVSRLAIESWVCRAFRSEPFELTPCLTLGLERVKASGTGSGTGTRSQSATATWMSGGAGVFGRVYAAPFFAVLLGFGAKLEGARPRLVVDRLGEVDQLRPAAFWVKAGPEWIF